MPLLKDLLNSQLFSGVPSNAVWDLIKVTWEKVTARSWEDLYLDAFEAALSSERPRLAKYGDGDIGLDRDTLRQVLHYDLGAPVASLEVGTLSDEQFSTGLAVALENRQALTIGGNNLSEEDYAQIVRGLVRRATATFRASVLSDQAAFQRAMMAEALDNRELLRQTQEYLGSHFQLVLARLDEHGVLLGKILANTEDLKQSQRSQPSGGTAPPSQPETKQPQVAKTPPICILHLSGLNITTGGEEGKYYQQLTVDLERELNVRQLDYVVIAGDVAETAAPAEYEAAASFVTKLAQRFTVDVGRIIAVPGNHDVNWALSKQAYRFIDKADLPLVLPEGAYIPAGDEGLLLRDETLYQRRFEPFSTFFYSKLHAGEKYPSDYADQGILHSYQAHHIIFLALNSCWEIDHYRPHRQRSSINVAAITQALDKIQGDEHADWLKIAVWHHPAEGSEAMQNLDFLQLLVVHGFRLCLTGHFYEPLEGVHKYDSRRSIQLIGTGLFGVPPTWGISGIPMHYNLLTVDQTTDTITVETRKKEKPDGAWMADARWGDKNNPSPRYTIQLK